MTRAALGVVVIASALALAAGQNAAARPILAPTTYSYKILDAPTSGDERAIRNLGLQPEAQRRSDRLFSALAAVLGGSAPALNFVPTGSPLVGATDLSTNLTDRPGAPIGQINVDPLAVEGFINDSSAVHSGAINQLPHEMMHTRQTPLVLASLADSEGGAQAFADLVTPEAARRAHIPYTPGNFDGVYSDFVRAAQAKGNDWLLGGQMGKPPVPWP